MQSQTINDSVAVLFEWAWKTSLQASVLIVLVLAVHALFGQCLKARWRYALSLLVLIRLLLPTVPPSSYSIFNLGNRLAPEGADRILFQRNVFADHEPGVFASAVTPTFLSAGREAFQPLVFGRGKNASILAGWKAGVTRFTGRSSATVQPNPAPPDSAPVEAQAIATSNSPPRTHALLTLAVVSKWMWALGACLILLTTFERHRRFARWVRGQELVTNPRIVSLLGQSKATLGVAGGLVMRQAARLSTPALFGLRRPCLLVPAQILERLDQAELRLVFLHELAHLKRRDILLNWVIILVRALHWFNPLVWVAMKQLRSDREMVCDEMVLTRLNWDERQLYGNTLIKLLSDFSKVRLCPSLAPVIHSKSEIKRRITMIAQFKPITRLALSLSAVLVTAVCCLTFTRAAERSGPAGSKKKEMPTLADLLQQESERGSASERSIKLLEEQLAGQERELRKSQDRLDQFRKELQIPDWDDRPNPIQPVEPETVRMIERDRIMAKSLQVQYGSLYTNLIQLQKDKLRKAIPTASPDAQLTEFLINLAKTENELASYVNDFGANNPTIVRLTSIITNLNSQIDARVEGILTGLAARAAAEGARAAFLDEEEQNARKRDAELMEKYRPYLKAKRDLEIQQRIFETIKLRLLQETVDASLPKKPADIYERLATLGVRWEKVDASLPKPADGKKDVQEPKAPKRGQRNIHVPVPLTRSVVAFVAADPAKPNDYDKLVTLNLNGEEDKEAQAEKIVVNLRNSGGKRFAVARISLLSDAEEFIEFLNESRERLLDAAGGAMADKSLADIEKPGFRNMLRSELRMLFNAILGAGAVKEVIITEFVMQ